jgi:hypothetical protein
VGRFDFVTVNVLTHAMALLCGGESPFGIRYGPLISMTNNDS